MVRILVNLNPGGPRLKRILKPIPIILTLVKKESAG